MENIKCIFCGDVKSHTVIEENGYTGRKCEICNLIYISPRPTQQEISEIYSKDRIDYYTNGHIAKEFMKRLFAKHTLKSIKKYSRSGSLLEIGSGAGFFLDEAKKRKFNTFGNEISAKQCEYTKTRFNIPCVSDSFSPAIFNNKKYDIIYHCDVLSHFYNPIEEFKKMNEALNDNGLLVFETGNFGDVEKKYYKYFNSFQYPDHLFFFSDKSIKKLLISTGFESFKIMRYSLLPELIYNRLFLKYISKNSQKQIKVNNFTNQKIISDETNNSNNRIFLITILKKLNNYFSYILRYQIGNIIPKNGRPQTIIVIARKIK
ncbi:MAG TPA: class I SAM-dependent methyltransferase [Candidatus Paceibacterota bacterium]